MAGGDKRMEGELGAQSLQRSVRSLKTKEAMAKEQSEILKLKREAIALMKRIPVEEVHPAAGKKRKVIKKELSREFIEYIMLKPDKPLHGFREEELPKRSDKFRQFYAEEKAISDKILEYQQALIKQFLKRGYALNYKEVEVTDNNHK
ncbi:unnamed protein product [Urochloa humidicola]